MGIGVVFETLIHCSKPNLTSMRRLNLVFLVFLLGFSFSLHAQLNTFFTTADQFFQRNVSKGLVNYQGIKQTDASLNNLQQQIATIDLRNADADTRKAFYINAYNILVIAQVVDNYPINSPLAVSGFFDQHSFQVANESLTLNQLEKEKLLETYKDPRFHFVLVCGALDCPPIISQAYMPNTLEDQLEHQTRLALNNTDFIRTQGQEVALSQIFEWYTNDFGGNKKSAIDYINQYHDTPLSNVNVRFYSYDWSLNQLDSANNEADSLSINLNGNNSARYVVSATIPTGSFEIKGFTNLYNQVTGDGEGPATDQATFFTQNLSVLYGATNLFNAGFDVRYRQVNFGPESNSRFDVFNLEQTMSTRQGITGFGPKIRYAPFKALPNFSVQSTYWFAIGEDLAGNQERPFIDFNGDTWFTQIFNDFPLGENFSIFTELDILLEDIGNKADGHINRFSTPVQAIFSYFPNKKTTLYTIGSYSPYWQENFDYFYQAGLGAKYQITPKLEAEVLYTQFRNQFILDTNGTASTINFGLRISIF